MQLTLESDYAIRIISVIAEGWNDPSESEAAASVRMDAKSISDISGVPLRFSLKILRKLVAGGLVRSYKGTRGGYELAKAPNEISVLDVVEITEGKIHINRCISKDFVCTRPAEGPCKFKKCFDDISAEIRNSMRNITFDRFIE
ncbi:MAG: Rrf2 family transcriptional regulator [Oscillospiraceae bacterium]|nr:Rrf2 family transcriptional regulator [Oscillospiraceae bacterium]